MRLLSALVSRKVDGSYLGVIKEVVGSSVKVVWLIPSSLYPEGFQADVRLDSVTVEPLASLMLWGFCDDELMPSVDLVQAKHEEMMKVRSRYPHLTDPKFLQELKRKDLSKWDKDTLAYIFDAVMREGRVPRDDYKCFPDIHEVYGYA